MRDARQSKHESIEVYLEAVIATHDFRSDARIQVQIDFGVLRTLTSIRSASENDTKYQFDGFIWQVNRLTVNEISTEAEAAAKMNKKI